MISSMSTLPSFFAVDYSRDSTSDVFCAFGYRILYFGCFNNLDRFFYIFALSFSLKPFSSIILELEMVSSMSRMPSRSTIMNSGSSTPYPSGAFILRYKHLSSFDYSDRLLTDIKTILASVSFVIFDSTPL